LKIALHSISDQTLGKQIKELEVSGLIIKNIIAEVPVKVEYQLTAKGEALLPILSDLSEWSDI